MREYEYMMILDPDMSEADRESLLQEILHDLSEVGFTKKNEDVWWVRDLAYPIAGSDRGYYVIYILEGDGSGIIPVTKILNLKKPLWRFIFVRLDSEA